MHNLFKVKLVYEAVFTLCAILFIKKIIIVNMTYDSLRENSSLACHQISNSQLIYYAPVNSQMDDATIRRDYHKRRLVLM